MKTVNVAKKKMVIHIYFLIFSKLFLKKTIFCVVPIHLDNFCMSYNFFWVYSDPEHFFYFLSSSYQKKYALLQVFCNKISSNWPDRPKPPWYAGFFLDCLSYNYSENNLSSFVYISFFM